MVIDEIDDTKWDAQLRKGTLELVVLAILKDRQIYGLELLKSLHQFDSMQISEGTLYPLLDRLTRDGLVEAEWLIEGDSRPRKYYQLSDAGEEKRQLLIHRWRQSVTDIEYILTYPGPGSLFDE